MAIVNVHRNFNDFIKISFSANFEIRRYNNNNNSNNNMKEIKQQQQPGCAQLCRQIQNNNQNKRN